MSIKKITSIGVSLTTAIWLSGALMMPVAQAATVDELQAQINALLAQIQALQTQLASAQGTSGSSYSFTKDLTLGSKGDDVTALQNLLISANKGSAAAALVAVGATGYFGNLTKAALAEYQAAAGISPAAGYFGPKTRAYVASLGGGTTGGGTTGGGTTPTVPTSGIVLALASDNPATITVPRGATGVAFLKFTAAGKGTIDSLVFQRKGVGSTSDFNSGGFYLYEGATRLTSGRTINSTTHQVSFLNLGLSIDGIKNLSLVVDVSSSSSYAGDVDSFDLASAAGTPTPTGTLVGNPMSIGTSAVGTITATSGASPTNPYVGQAAALLGEFKLAAGSTEDVNISRVAVTQGGTISDAYLTNLVLKVSGTQVATASGVGAKDLITFSFDTPYKLEKGQQRTFQVYGDIGGGSKTSDTIVLYFDSASDIIAKGVTYGYSVYTDIIALDTTSEGDTITLSGGDVTISTAGPVAGDIAVRAQDVNLLNFTIAAKNNVEIRNLRLNASTTGAIALYSDIKVWDTTTNSVVTSAQSITTSASSTNLTFTDIINIGAGQSKSFKVTADVDSTNSTSGTIHINILAFQANDIKNTDNNTFVSTSNIVPNSQITGNDMTIRATTLDVQLAASPTSQTYVQGVNGVALAGYSLRAISGDVKVTSIKITATSSTGTLTSGEVQSLGLYDGATLLGTTKSLDSTSLYATFDNLNLVIASGATKVITLKGNISANASNTDVYYFYVTTADSNSITVYDNDGNSASISGIAANNTGTVSITITTTGTVTVARAPDDTDSQAGIIIAGTEAVLAKYRFTAVNEDMTLNKLDISVINSASATATSTAASDEAPTIKLYDGSTQIGATGGYTVTGSGANAGTAYIQSLGWVIPKNSSKTLTIKGVLNTVSGGADAGASVYANIMTISSGTDFEAAGQTNKQTTITGATGNEMVVYKTKPTIGAPTAASSKLTAGLIPAIRFTIKADGPEQVAWQQIQFKVAMTGATMTAINAVPSTSGTVQLKDVDSNTVLNIASGFSSTSNSTAEQVAFQGGTTGYVSLYMNAEQVIAAGATKTYELSLTFANLGSTAGTSYASINLYASETTVSNGITVTGVSGVRGSSGTTTDAAPSFVWSDYSNTSHTASTADWANGVYVQVLPSTVITISN
jgi:hypothetical protein